MTVTREAAFAKILERDADMGKETVFGVEKEREWKRSGNAGSGTPLPDSDLSPRFTCKVNLSNTNRFYFGLPFRQRNATCKLAATEDSLVLHKIMFRGYPNTGLPGKPSHKMGFRSSVSKSGHPGEGKHEGLVRRSDVLTNGFI